MRGLLPTLVLSIIAPLVTFNVLRNNGASDFAAYLWASAGPLLETVGMALIRREADKVAMLILGITVVSAILTAVGSASETMLLLKDSAMTGAFGVICLVTVLPVVPRPLMFYFAQKFWTGGSDAGMHHFDDMWRAYPGFRRSFRVITATWGVAYVLEAAVKVVLAETVSFDTAYNANQVLPLVVFASLLILNIWYGRRMQRLGEERRRAAARADASGAAGAVRPS